MAVVPNVVHFIWLTGPKSREFSYINYLTVLAAAKHQKPDKIIMWINKPPQGNQWFHKASFYFEIRCVNAPDFIAGTPINHVQYQSDVLRMEILIAHGGIFLDTDLILLKSVTPLLDEPLTLFEESPSSIANGIIFAAPNSLFLRHWLDATPEALKKPVWAYHAVVLPVELSRKYPDLVRVMDQSYFFPLDLKRNYLFDGDPYLIEESIHRIGNAHGIHVYETYWRDYIKGVDEDFLLNRDTLMSRLFGYLTDTGIG
jgi:hypothetical protein